MGEVRPFRRRKPKKRNKKAIWIDCKSPEICYIVWWKKRVGLKNQREIYRTLESFVAIHEAWNLHSLKYQLGVSRNKYEDEFIRILKMRYIE